MGKIQVNTCKYIGITLSSNLEWEERVNYVSRKSRKTLHFVMIILKGQPQIKRTYL